MHAAHLPLLIVFGLAAGLATFILTLSNWLGPRRPSSIKVEPFECGNPPSGPAIDRFNVKFYLVAILFLVFDIEAVFIYPWAVVFGETVRGEGSLAPLQLLQQMATFIGIVVVGLAYAWRKGALEWDVRPDQEPRPGADSGPQHTADGMGEVAWQTNTSW